jgi:phage tail sheath gpL-like
MISFNSVPGNSRVPFMFAEFDSSKAQQGTSIKAYKALMLGQKLAAGTATANVPVTITSEAQAITLFGRGSFLSRQVKAFLAANKFTSLTVIPQADNGAGIQATGTITVTGPATAAGTIALMIAGQKVEVAVASGDIATAIATAIVAALDDALDLPVTSAVGGAGSEHIVTLTCRHKGLLGNGVDIRHSYYTGEALPAGVGLALVAMANGTTAPSLTTSIANMTETQYDVICCPYNDATSLTAIEAELLDRWGPVRQNDGVAFSCKDDTHANLVTFGDGRNSKHVSMLGVHSMPNPSYEIAASLSAVAAYYLQIDPARPLQTLELPGILPPAKSDEFTLQERNLLLFDGIATCKVTASGTIALERVITMYQVNSASAPDTAYLDVMSLFTLSFIRWDWRNHMLTKYPRHKLASDGTRFGAGQAIITPKVGKAEAIAKFRQWEEMGLVEGADQFKRDLICERNSGDTNRLDFLLSPDLMNQLMVMGTQIQFLL